jgi:hypothetical protein
MHVSVGLYIFLLLLDKNWPKALSQQQRNVDAVAFNAIRVVPKGSKRLVLPITSRCMHVVNISGYKNVQNIRRRHIACQVYLNRKFYHLPYI